MEEEDHEREKSIEIGWWRPERDRKWIYIHNSFCAPFDFWKGSRCVSLHTAATIVVQWFTGLQMNMEQAQFATLAGSFPTERQTFSQSVTSPLLWKTGERGVRDEGWWQRKEGLRDRMRNVMKVTKWQKEDNKTRCLCWVCFLMLRSPWCRGMLEIIWSAAWKRVSVIHESCNVNSGPVFKCYKREYLGCLSTLSCH